MRGLKERIAGLSDEEAVDAAGCLAGWMAERAKERLPLEVLKAVEDEGESMGLLAEDFPELADRLRAIFEDDVQKGQAARKLLLFLAERENYTAQVKEAIDRPALKFAESMTMSLGMAISLLLFLEFDVEYVDKKGGKRLRISKKTPVLEIFMKLLGL